MSNNKVPKFKWTSFPLIEHPIKSIFLIIFLIVFSFLLWRYTVIKWEMPIFYFLGMIYLLLSLITYFIPTTYEFYEDKIIIKYISIKIEKKYEDFACFYYDKNSLTLSTFKRPRRLDVFRGQMIRFSKDKIERKDVIEFLRTKVEEYNA